MEGIPEIQSVELPEITLEQVDLFDSKKDPIFYTRILNAAGENIGKVHYMLRSKTKEIVISHIGITSPRQGYGKATYKYIQDMYPDYTLVSSGKENMVHKTDENQEIPDAIRLWESLVKAGLAEFNGEVYRMKK
ncbi:MAG TPA: hypothetical protein VGC58_01165 [Candidatus Paceibacterota bacterium]